LRLDGITTEPPSWLATEASGRIDVETDTEHVARNGRGLIWSVRLWVGGKSAIARLYFTPEALAALDAAHNPLLVKRTLTKEEKLKACERFVPHVPLHLLVGRTEATVADLAQLERGDVLIVEHQQVKWRDGKFSGQARVRAGDGHNVALAGTIAGIPPTPSETNELDDDRGAGSGPEDETIRLVIDQISVASARTGAKRLMMDDEKNIEGADEEGMAEALDEMMLTVYIELGTRLVSLTEVASLRAGQVLDLGCKATDPVELTTGDRRIARGELVDIEGRLGVRITKVLG
jgi:type III secretion system YscQ/HrcQ family protein